MIIEENGLYRVVREPCKECAWQYSQNRLERWCDKCRRAEICVQVNPTEWLEVTSLKDLAVEEPQP